MTTRTGLTTGLTSRSTYVVNADQNIVQEEETTKSSGEKKEEANRDIRTQIAEMGFAEKIKLAMLGNSIVRQLLIFDTNKLVSEAVLQNPRLTVNEIEEFVKNPNISPDIIRNITNVSGWMKHYPLKKNLINNPKTPPDVTLKWLKFLQTKDLRDVSRSKNLPTVVVTAAKKMVANKAKQ
jgi:hypothetical protein